MNSTYIIGEIGQNHNGSVDIAKLIVDLVSRPVREEVFNIELRPMDAVKLTKRDLNEELTDSQMNRPYDSPHSFGRTYGEHRAFLELTDEEHFEVYRHAKSLGLDFVETLCSKGCLSLLKLFTPDRLKVASRDLTNLPLLEVMAETKIPIILSTGMAGRKELDDALEVITRYQMNDLRGAMADYDQVISMDSRNLIARFNRGLLRFQVGDNNRAIEDFDVVIQQEPDNYMADYNRALLRFETGDYRGAVQDYDVVLKQYPTFLPGFVSRSEAKRKLGDNVGADRDYWAAIKMEEQAKNGQIPKTSSSGSNTAVNGDAKTDDSEENTREQSDKNINKFNRLVVYDKEQERKSKYQSEVRGRP